MIKKRGGGGNSKVCICKLGKWDANNCDHISDILWPIFLKIATEFGDCDWYHDRKRQSKNRWSKFILWSIRHNLWPKFLTDWHSIGKFFWLKLRSTVCRSQFSVKKPNEIREKKLRSRFWKIGRKFGDKLWPTPCRLEKIICFVMLSISIVRVVNIIIIIGTLNIWRQLI